MAQIVKINNWGKSLALRIPSSVAHYMDLKAGDTLRLHYKENCIILEAGKSKAKMFEEWLDLFNSGAVKADFDSWLKEAR